MARYIDADKIKQAYCGDCGIDITDELCHRDCAMWSVVDSVPTEDVVSVVRCKDCRNCKKSLFTLSEEYICLYTQKTTTLDDYCSVAVKRDEDVD